MARACCGRCSRRGGASRARSAAGEGWFRAPGPRDRAVPRGGGGRARRHARALGRRRRASRVRRAGLRGAAGGARRAGEGAQGRPRPLHAQPRPPRAARGDRRALRARLRRERLARPGARHPGNLAALARERGVAVVSDEIYHGLTEGGRDRSILEFTDQAFVLNGFSKAFAMTGWRLGWVIAPPEHVRSLQTLYGNFFISTNEFVQ